jgi:hypothetical protein
MPRGVGLHHLLDGDSDEFAGVSGGGNHRRIVRRVNVGGILIHSECAAVDVVKRPIAFVNQSGKLHDTQPLALTQPVVLLPYLRVDRIENSDLADTNLQQVIKRQGFKHHAHANATFPLPEGQRTRPDVGEFVRASQLRPPAGFFDPPSIISDGHGTVAEGGVPDFGVPANQLAFPGGGEGGEGYIGDGLRGTVLLG